MDIVSDLPFKLQLIKRFPAMTIQNAEIFYTDEHEMWSQDIATLSAEENDEIEMLFESDDDKARHTGRISIFGVRHRSSL